MSNSLTTLFRVKLPVIAFLLSSFAAHGQLQLSPSSINVGEPRVLRAVSISQEAPILTLSRQSFHDVPASGQTFTINVTSNLPWIVEENSFLSVSPSSGTRNGTITLRVPPNTGNYRVFSFQVRTTNIFFSTITSRSVIGSQLAAGQEPRFVEEPFAVYSNPVLEGDPLKVSGHVESDGFYEFSIVSPYGETRLNQNIYVKDGIIPEMDVSSLISGIYILRISDPSKKLIGITRFEKK
jgi:hypothetical protein